MTTPASPSAAPRPTPTSRHGPASAGSSCPTSRSRPSTSSGPATSPTASRSSPRSTARSSVTASPATRTSPTGSSRPAILPGAPAARVRRARVLARPRSTTSGRSVVDRSRPTSRTTASLAFADAPRLRRGRSAGRAGPRDRTATSPTPPPYPGVEFTTVAADPDLLRRAYPVAEQGYADLALATGAGDGLARRVAPRRGDPAGRFDRGPRRRRGRRLRRADRLERRRHARRERPDGRRPRVARPRASRPRSSAASWPGRRPTASARS